MTASGRARRPPRFVRIVRARPRLFLCALLSLVVIAWLGTQQAQRILNRVAPLNAHQCGDLMLIVCRDDLVRSRRKHKIVRMRGNDIRARRVDHL